MIKCNVLVVGGGPSGSFASSLLSKAGLDVCLIDRSSFPRDKICGGLITQKAHALILAHMPDLKIVSSQIDGIAVFHKNDLVLSLTALSPLKLVWRYQFDNALLNESIHNGTKALLGQSIIAYDFDIKTILLENHTEIHYDFLIGADGVFSTVRQKMGLPKNLAGFCADLQMPYPSEEGFIINQRMVEIHYGFCERGYAWLFPREDALVTGLGNVENFKNKKHIVTAFDTFCKARGIPQNTSCKGAHLPSGNTALLGLEGLHDILLVGDAAGLIDPITGEGIYYALYSAKKAAEAILAKGNVLADYYRSMHPELNRIRSAIQTRDTFLNPVALKHNLSSLQNVPQYVEALIDDTILNYSRSYKDASDELFQLLR